MLQNATEAYEMTDQELLDSVTSSTGVWCKTMFPKRFRAPFSLGHKKAFSYIDNPYLDRLLIVCHRGWGKSSIMQLGIPSREICLQSSNIIIPCSATSTLAEEKSERLKWELENNRLIVQLFGNQKGERWSREEWVTRNGRRILPRGAGQQVRGIGDDNRPDLLLPDDLETKEGVASEEQRNKLKEWFFSDFMGMISQADEEKTRVVMLGTPLSHAALLVEIAEDPRWTVVRCPLFEDDNLISTWPEYISDQRVKELEANYRHHGKLDTFWREWGLKVVPPDSSFPGVFNYYDETKEDLNKRTDVENIVIIDPSKTVTPTSDESGIIGAAFSPATNHVFVREAIGAKLYPNELYDQAFALAKLINARAIGIEVTTLNEWIVWPLKNEILRRGLNLELVELKAKGKKEDRIRGLIPLYRMSLIKHNQHARDISKLEGQLRDFPSSKHDDLMDSLAYVVPMLSKGERYMTIKDDSIYELSSADYTVAESKAIEAEFKQLESEYDPAFDEDWMLV